MPSVFVRSCIHIIYNHFVARNCSNVTINIFVVNHLKTFHCFTVFCNLFALGLWNWILFKPHFCCGMLHKSIFETQGILQSMLLSLSFGTHCCQLIGKYEFCVVVHVHYFVGPVSQLVWQTPKTINIHPFNKILLTTSFTPASFKHHRPILLFLSLFQGRSQTPVLVVTINWAAVVSCCLNW